jgi:uncharacterized protein with GYD domain
MERRAMLCFISLANWTEQGIKSVMDSPKRLEAAKAPIAGFGGKLISFYYTVGKYDFVFLTEFPTDELATQFLMSLGRLGNVRTSTLGAYSESEGIKLTNSLQ